jgi:hypothetical protein
VQALERDKGEGKDDKLCHYTAEDTGKALPANANREHQCWLQKLKIKIRGCTLLLALRVSGLK